MTVEAEIGVAFEGALDRQGVTWTRTTAASFESALSDAVVEPAVGTRLGIDGVSLSGTSVTIDPTPSQLRDAETGVTRAEIGIAEHGTLALQSDPFGTEPISLYPNRHVAVLRGSDVVADVPAAMEWLCGEIAAGRDSTVFATGPSATGDMGALVYGVHGPGEVHVLLVSDR